MNDWNPLPALSPPVIARDRPQSAAELVRELEKRRHLLSLTPLQERWRARAFAHLWRVGSREERRGFSQSTTAVQSALSGLGRGINAPWLSSWLHFDFRNCRGYLERDWQELVDLDIMREGWTDESFPWGVHPSKTFDAPVPPDGVLLEGKPNEGLLSALERWAYELKALEQVLLEFRHRKHSGPAREPSFRNITWTWQYYVERLTYNTIADKWTAETGEVVGNDYVKEYVKRCTEELALRRSRQSSTAPAGERLRAMHEEAYSTFNGLVLKLQQPSKGLYLVTFEAEDEPQRRKILYEGGNKRKARKSFNETQAMYEERAKAEAD